MPGRESQLVSAQQVISEISRLQSALDLLDFLAYQFSVGDGLYLDLLNSYLKINKPGISELQNIANVLIKVAFCSFTSVEEHFRQPLVAGSHGMFFPDSLSLLDSKLTTWTNATVNTKLEVLKASKYQLNDQEKLRFWSSYKPNSPYPYFTLPQNNTGKLLPNELMCPRYERGFVVYYF